MKFADACLLAQNSKLDLVLVSENDELPVCRIMNFGKLCYEQKKKQKEQKKSQQAQKVKEIKFRLNIDMHDYECKINHGKEFLADGCKLRITIMFRGREIARKEMGTALVDRIVADFADCATLDSPAKEMGRNLTMSFSPSKG